MIKINNVIVNNDSFPNGELKIDEKFFQNLKKLLSDITIDFHFEGNKDLTDLILIVSYIYDQTKMKPILNMKYMPYSRMDRQKIEKNYLYNDKKTAFTLKYICNVINTLPLKLIRIFEPHSDVCCALLNNVEIKYPTVDLLREAMIENNYDKKRDIIFYPDAGAQKRYTDLLKYPNVVGFKHRNWENGKIEKLEVCGDLPEKGFNVYIVDDLCSFGGTFILAAEKLKELGANKIFLIVGHCENSIVKGKIPESDLIATVYTTNSIFTERLNKVKVYDCQE